MNYQQRKPTGNNKQIPPKKTSGQESFRGELNLTFKEEQVTIILKATLKSRKGDNTSKLIL